MDAACIAECAAHVKELQTSLKAKDEIIWELTQRLIAVGVHPVEGALRTAARPPLNMPLAVEDLAMPHNDYLPRIFTNVRATPEQQPTLSLEDQSAAAGGIGPNGRHLSGNPLFRVTDPPRPPLSPPFSTIQSRPRAAGLGAWLGP
jgi:hypothetical protein